MTFLQSVWFHAARALVEVGVWIAFVAIVLIVTWVLTRNPTAATVRKRERERKRWARNQAEDEILPQPSLEKRFGDCTMDTRVLVPRCEWDKAGRVIPGYAPCPLELHHEGPCAHALADGSFPYAATDRVRGSVKLYPTLRDTTLDELASLVASQILNNRGFTATLAMKLNPLLDPPPVDTQALAVEVAQLLTPQKE